MRAARMYGYKQPLRLEDIPIPEAGSDEVLVKVGAAGMCRTDFQLIDGYFRDSLPLSIECLIFPLCTNAVARSANPS